MKINKLLILAALPMIGLTANAQDKGPQKNDFTVAATVSYNNTVMQNAAVGTLPSYNGFQAQSTNWNDKSLQVGIEGGWFFLDEWKLVLGGGMSITKHPGYSGVPGTADSDESFEWGDVPSYGAVAIRTSCNSMFTQELIATSRRKSTVCISMPEHAWVTPTDVTSHSPTMSTTWVNQLAKRSTYAEH